MYLEDRIAELEQLAESLSSRIISLENRGADRFVTAKELAKNMGCSENTIYRKYRAGELEGTRSAGGVRFPMSQFYDKQKVVRIPPKRGSKMQPQSIKEQVFG